LWVQAAQGADAVGQIGRVDGHGARLPFWIAGLKSEPEAVVINTEIIRRDLGCDATAEE
jgi:hypothetical protein